jgi:hypothetical protein
MTNSVAGYVVAVSVYQAQCNKEHALIPTLLYDRQLGTKS